MFSLVDKPPGNIFEFGSGRILVSLVQWSKVYYLHFKIIKNNKSELKDLLGDCFYKTKQNTKLVCQKL